MLPKIAELEYDEQETFTEDLPPIGKSFLFDYSKGDFVMENGRLVELHGKEALKAWIEKILRTEADRFKIYEGTDYGVGIERMIGLLPREIIDGELERVITEKLTEHTHIDDVQEWEFEQVGNRMIISFTVITPDDAFRQEVTM